MAGFMDNPAALAYMLGQAGAAVSPKGSWQQGLGQASAAMGGQMQQARALQTLLAPQPGSGNMGFQSPTPGWQGSVLDQLVSGSGYGQGLEAAAGGSANSAMNAGGSVLPGVGDLGFKMPTPAAQAPVSGPEALQTMLPSSSVEPSKAALLSTLLPGSGGQINPMALSLFSNRQGFNMPPELFAPENALGADLPNMIKTAAGVAQVQDELSGTKATRDYVLKELPLERRLQMQETLADKRGNLALQLQAARDQAADSRLDKRERAAAERQAVQIGAMLEGIDRRISATQERFGQPVQGQDENGNPAWFRFDKQGGPPQKVEGGQPMPTAENKAAMTTLTTLITADTKALDGMNSSDPNRAATLARIEANRAALQAMVQPTLNRRGAATPSPQGAPISPSAPAQGQASGQAPTGAPAVGSEVMYQGKRYKVRGIENGHALLDEIQ